MASSFRKITLVIAISAAVSLQADAQPERVHGQSGVVVPTSGLLFSRSESDDDAGRRFARWPASDPIHARLVEGTLPDYQPVEEQLQMDGQPWRWTRVEFAESGSVDRRGLYLYVPIELDEERVLILDAAGQSETYVNGEPRTGNVYGDAYVHLPAAMHRGTNHLILRAGRGPFRVKLYAPPSPVFLNRADQTLPDLVAGENVDTWGAAVVINARTEPAEGLLLACSGPGLTNTVTPVPSIPPLTIRKVPFRIRAAAQEETGELSATLQLSDPTGNRLHGVPADLKVVRADEPRRVTFISQIDGSVQFFGLRTATDVAPEAPPPAIVLSCHGAAVDARGQSASYSSKSWFHTVAPTNRRPFGYDWEDFGRADALEVLEIAQRSLRHDPFRVYVTGHSMGGHGAWHLAVTYPDRFAAVGPSAGWLSRSSYGRRRREESRDSPLDALWSRCRTSGDTVALATNLKQLAVYMLHGADDDNVPAAQARKMAEVLDEFHRDWTYHEEPQQGHWWSNEYGDGGAACVDWPFMFDLFARHALPPTSAVREIEFVTANPGVSSQCHWLAIEGQLRQLDLSRAHLHMWPDKRLFRGTTENVAVLRLDVRHLREPGPVSVEIDGQMIADIPYPDAAKFIYLGRERDEWQIIEKPPPRHKGPHRYGGIKDELKHRLLFVYGTHGTAEENAWASGKARLDAETFWYRGNASVDILADSQFDPAHYADRTVVLYGNAETNTSWSALLGDSPVQVRRGEVRVGDRGLQGDDLSAIFLRPRPDSDVASVVAVSGSGPPGMRSTYLQSCFIPAVRYPDCVINRASRDGNRDSTIVGGFFGLDWSVDNGEFVFADESESIE